MERRPWLLGGWGASFLAMALAMEIWRIAKLAQASSRAPCQHNLGAIGRNNIVNYFLRVLDNLHPTMCYSTAFMSAYSLDWTYPSGVVQNAMLFWSVQAL